MKFLAAMESRSVDHVICDPPYDEKTHKGMRRRNEAGAADVVQLGFDELEKLHHVPELLRVSRGWVIAFCALEQLGEYKRCAGESWVRAGFWDRVTGMPQFSADRPAQPGEGLAIMWAGEGRMSWNGGGRHALWTMNRTNGENHPTEKPTLLMEQLIRDFTDYGDTILDPFCGSGSTGVAAIRTGRNFIGIEMLDKYADIAVKRLSSAHEQKELVFAKRKKEKNLTLNLGGDHVEEEGKAKRKKSRSVGRKGPVSGDLLDPRKGEARTPGEGEGEEDHDGGAVLPGHGDQVRSQASEPEGAEGDGVPEAIHEEGRAEGEAAEAHGEAEDDERDLGYFGW
jgi:site-specific DNA-methyltransferase (adenine-specific)